MPEDQLEELFHQLADLPIDSRRERLDALRLQEPDLHRQVSLLLAALEEAPSFLTPVEDSAAIGVNSESMSHSDTPPRGQSPADRRSRSLPRHLGKYVIEEEIGRGAMGVVYLARDPDLERAVAVKLLPRGSLGPRTLRKLREEARLLASVSHPNVAQVHSIEEIGSGDKDPAAILTMEYIPGCTLAERLRRSRVPQEEALDYGRQIAAALEAAHQSRVIHRDLKPQNIRVTPDGWVKVLDFGLAEVMPPEQPAPIESEMARHPSAGTPGYMSPEQSRGEPVDPRSDLWAFGAVLFECLTGEPALNGTDLAELLESNRRGEVDLSRLPAVSPRVDELLRSCLAPDPRERVSSGAAARRVLEEELLRIRSAELYHTPEGARGSPTEPATYPGNMPRPWSSFVGRSEQLTRLDRALSEARLVTLVGPGGVGKTRTSLELAAKHDGAFPGGSWFIDLSAINHGAEVAATVVRTLRAGGAVPPGRPGDTHRAVVDAFGGERGLLLLDNCDHLIEGVAQFVQALLSIPSAIFVLATSRQPLGLSGECVIVLPPLKVPEESPDGRDAEPADSVRLFLDRARNRGAHFGGESQALGTIGEICRHLDGLPLAIELAASHARGMPVEELLHLVETGRALPLTNPALPERHRSLHRLVDWSYALLAAKEQSLLRRLSIFRGGWTLSAAESICGGWGGVDAWEVYGLLARLVEQSLVEPEPNDPTEKEDAAPPARYRLLETIRTFAAEHLSANPPEEEFLRDRFLAHLRSLAEIRQEEKTPVRSAWVRRTARDHANLLHGLDLALRAGRLGTAYVLAEPLGTTWIQTGQWIDGARWMDRILAARATSPKIGAEDRAAEVRILSQAGLLAAIQGLAGKAGPIIQEALSCAEALGDLDPLAQAHEAAGVAAWRSNQLDDAQVHLERSRRCFEEAEDWGGVAVATGNLGVLECTRGHLEPARRRYEEYLRIARRMHDTLAEAAALGNLGGLAGAEGRTDDARSLIERSAALHLENRDLPAAAMAFQNLGELLIRIGRIDEARNHLREAYRIRRRQGDRVGLLWTLIVLCRAVDQSGEGETAAEILSGVLRHIEEGDVRLRPDTMEGLQRLRSELAQRLGEARMQQAVERGERHDLKTLLAMADPGGTDVQVKRAPT